METILTINEAAAYLHIQPETLKLWVREGWGPTRVKLSPRKIISREIAIKGFLDK